MKRTVSLFAALFFILGASIPAYGQKATEIYIPIGESPGLSDELTYQGSIAGVDQEQRRLTVRDDAGSHVIQINEQTKIWLDKSALREKNEEGSFEDCRVGVQVEILYDHAAGEPYVAEWVKIAVTN